MIVRREYVDGHLVRVVVKARPAEREQLEATGQKFKKHVKFLNKIGRGRSWLGR